MIATIASWPHAIVKLTRPEVSRMAQRTYPLVQTADDLHLLPDDGNRYELIDGVLFVTPAPRLVHQRAQIALVERLLPYTRALSWELLVAPTAIRASPWTQVQPDLLVASAVPSPLGDARWLSMSALSLAVEILSPSTADRDRGLKRRTYLANGVGEYWVVDLETRAIEVWHTADAPAARHQHALVWHPVATHSALTLDLTGYFAAVLDV